VAILIVIVVVIIVANAYAMAANIRSLRATTLVHYDNWPECHTSQAAFDFYWCILSPPFWAGHRGQLVSGMPLRGTRQPKDDHLSDHEFSQISPGDHGTRAGQRPTRVRRESRLSRVRREGSLARQRAASVGRQVINAAFSSHFMGIRELHNATATATSASHGRRRSRAASAGRGILQIAFARRPALPGAFRDKPTGTIEMPCGSLDSSWAECLRDLTRTLHGNGVYIVGPEQMYPLRAEMMTLGDLSHKTCEAAFGSLTRAVCDELTAQVALHSGAAAAPATSLRGSLWRQQQGGSASNWQLDSLELRELTRRVATHITVGPGMHVVLQQKLSPVLWQPAFVICVSRSQVRVLTFAFIGEPVTGDRPDRKCTPFILRLLTGNLAPVGPRTQQLPNESEIGVQISATAVHYMAEVVPASAIILDYILGMREQLCQLVRDDDWGQLVPFSCDPSATTR